MKNNYLKTTSSFLRINLFSSRRHLRYICFIVLIAFLNLTIGCYYYKVNTHQQPENELASKLKELTNQNKFLIVHVGDESWWLRNFMISEDKTELHGLKEELPYIRHSFQKTKSDKPNRYRKNQRYVLQEVHIYTHEYSQRMESDVVIPIESVQKIEVYDPHLGATVASFYFGYLAASALAAAAVAGLIILASCPFIYVFDGENYVFTGEIFSGATQPGLERHDYLRLPLFNPENEAYLIRVSNELQEIQHINLMQLQVIDHPAGIEVLADKYGQLHSISSPVSPLQAYTAEGNDILAMLTEKDTHSYFFDEAANTDATLDEIVLSFEKPKEAKQAKLIISAKNSLWLEYVMTNFHEMFGRKFNSFNKKQGREQPEDMREMMQSQGFPLNVYLEKDGLWELQDFFEIAGPMALKDDILVIDLEEIENDIINIKLETGLMFWEIDYVAMDFTPNIHLAVTTLSATEAIDENGNDVGNAILFDDDLYYVQPEIGNAATLLFYLPELTEESRTIILHSKGYYKLIREYNGIADRKTLRTFREPGRMANFSKELYEELRESLQLP